MKPEQKHFKGIIEFQTGSGYSSRSWYGSVSYYMSEDADGEDPHLEGMILEIDTGKGTCILVKKPTEE